MKFSIKDYFSKYEQTRRKLRIWSHLLKKSLMENLFFVQWIEDFNPGLDSVTYILEQGVNIMNENHSVPVDYLVKIRLVL